MKIKCPRCKKSFKSSQGLANHLNYCGQNREGPEPGEKIEPKTPKATRQDQHIVKTIWEGVGLGFEVKKVGGQWLPVVSLYGERYDEALAHCERRQAIDAIAMERAEGGESDEEFFQVLMLRMLDDQLERRRHPSNDIQTLIDENGQLLKRLQEMDSNRKGQWMDKIEEQIARLADRDPFGDVGKMREKLGVPERRNEGEAAKLIVDAGNKIDKTVDRFVADAERFLLLREKGFN